MNRRSNSSHAGTVSRLAVADILHEWRMSVCLVLAVAAIATPLLLFFGLKHGTVETLRKRLLDNPVTLEIMPVTEKLLDDDWFARWRQNPRVAFVVPHTRKLSAQADMAPAEAKKPVERVDVSPSMPGDILLTRYGLTPPGPDQCVLTFKAAEKLGAKPGDKLTCTVTREQARVKASHDFTVTGVLPVRANQLPAAYIPLEQLEHIEAFKDGRAVPAFGWPGADPLAYPVLGAVLVFTPDRLDAVKQSLLQQNTGFARLSALPEDEISQSGLPGYAGGYRLSTIGSPANKDNVSALRDKLRGTGAIIMAEPPSVRIVSAGAPTPSTPGSSIDPKEKIDLELLPATALGAALPGHPLPPGASGVPGAPGATGEPLASWSDFTLAPAERALLVAPEVVAALGSGPVMLKAVVPGMTPERSVEFEARLAADPNTLPGQARAPASLLGVLTLLEQRPLTFGGADGGNRTFLLGRRGYSGFRMYASGLEQVGPLAKELEESGIRANTRADRIDEVLNLNMYLNLLFWLIAATSLVGGTACLLSSIYANVERKRRDLAVLRLLGVHGGSLTAFPLVSGVVLTLCGLIMGLAAYHILSYAINTLFASHLDAGEAFCSLTLGHQAGAIGLGLAMSIVAGLAASRRFANIDPAECLRDE